MTLPGSRVPARVLPLELHRRQCEARHWSKQPDLKATLERIAVKRGQKAAEQLAEDIRAVRKGR